MCLQEYFLIILSLFTNNETTISVITISWTSQELEHLLSVFLPKFCNDPSLLSLT